MSTPPIKIGVIGTGFISRGFNLHLSRQSDFVASRILTRRPLDSCKEFPRQDILTHSLNEVIDHSDIILECSGDPDHAAIVVQAAFAAKLPVVTMNTEFHITCGSYFVDKGLLTEAEGDQPGCLAVLDENAKNMGFKPLVYGNVKGFHNLDPDEKTMRYWSKKQGISMPMVVASTDGTKVQAEQILVANGLGAEIVCDGLLGLPSDSFVDEVQKLTDAALERKSPISDFIIHATEEKRVFIVATHEAEQRDMLEYLKLGAGPYYTLSQNKILCHLEILKTIKRVVTLGTPLLNNSSLPMVSLAAVAKKEIKAGTQIKHGIGSYELRGIAVNILDHPDHVPMGLLSNITITKALEINEVLCFDHLDIDSGLALDAWLDIQQNVMLAGIT